MPAAEEVRTLEHAATGVLPAQQVRTHFDTPIAIVGVSAAAESANARVITLQVRDRLMRPWLRRWRVRVRIATTAGGDASGTGNTVAFTTGTVVETIKINGEYEVLSSAGGVVAFSLTIAGAATRFVHADVLGKDRDSASIGWAA